MADGVFTVIARELQQASVPHVLIGGVAVNHYGFSRSTKDLDLAIEEGQYEAVRRLLAKHGYEELLRFPATARLRHRSLLLPDVDFMLLDDATMKQLIATGLQIEIQGATFLIPSVVNLIAMKLHALKSNPNREWKDLPDICWMCIINSVDVESELFHSLIRRYGSNEWHDKIRQQIRSLKDSGSRP